MKHLLLALALLAAGAVSAGKLGVVEMDILLRLHPNTVADEALMKELVERLEAEQEKGKAQLKELNEAFEKAVEAYENPSLSDKQRAKAKADADRARKQAEADIEQLRKRAEEQARKMINDNEIMSGAKVQANELMRQADAKAKEMIAMAEKRSNELRGVANDYCEDALRRTEEAVNAALNEVKQSRSKFRSLAGLGNNRPTKAAYDVAAEEE